MVKEFGRWDARYPSCCASSVALSDEKSGAAPCAAPPFRVSTGRLNAHRLLTSVGRQVHLERCVVAKALIAPGVVVQGRGRPKLARSEEVVEAPAAAVARNAPPGPARLPSFVPMKGPEGVDVADLAEVRHHPKLSLVPLRAPFRAQPSLGISGERDHLAAGQLAARRIQVAAKDASRGRGGRQPGADRLQCADLHPTVGGVWDVDTVSFDATGALSPRRCGSCGLRPRKLQRRRLLQRVKRGDEHSGCPTCGRLPPWVGFIKRRPHVGQADRFKSTLPKRRRPAGDLLEGDDVRLTLRKNHGLLYEPGAAPGDVPADDAHVLGE